MRCVPLLLVLFFFAPPLIDYETNMGTSAIATEKTNPISDYWRSVRKGEQGYSAVKGNESGVLIQPYGESWRQIRNGTLSKVGAGFLTLTVFALGAFYLWRGQVKLTLPKTGKTIQRWSTFERFLHWYSATLFLVLSFTGLSLLFGRSTLMPLVGKNAFSCYAEIAKVLHNFLGPAFIIGLVLMTVIWFKDNLPNRLDIEWFKALGGFIGDKHPSAERMNGGEKAWFWLLVCGGIIVSFSGLILDFPIFGQQRWMMQASHIFHVICSILLIIGSLGHIYIGTIGTEGALQGMKNGRVEVAWAIQHHDIWYKEENNKKSTLKPPAKSTETTRK